MKPEILATVLVALRVYQQLLLAPYRQVNISEVQQMYYADLNDGTTIASPEDIDDIVDELQTAQFTDR